MQDYSKNKESQLVYSLSKGNLLAFNTIFREYSSRLYRFALGYLKSEDEAEELLGLIQIFVPSVSWCICNLLFVNRIEDTL